MAFVKLDTGILNSTLWAEREPRDVFITALLMAVPFATTEPMPQLKVDSLDRTGFIVPPGWYGFVEAAGPGIVRRSLADPVLGMEALATLGEPDLESRSSEFEGRRLVRVDGGYIVLNYMKYRQKDNTAVVRQKRYRDRKKEAKGLAKTPDSALSTSRVSRVTTTPSRRNVTPNVTKAEAEADIREIQAPTVLVENFAPTALVNGHAVDPKPPPESGYRVPQCPYAELLALFHESLPTLPHVVVFEEARKRPLHARWVEVCTAEKFNRDEGLEWFGALFRVLGQSDFLTGRAKDWKASFDWILKPTNFAKAVEGNYANTRRTH